VLTSIVSKANRASLILADNPKVAAALTLITPQKGIAANAVKAIIKIKAKTRKT
jgi:hypothetical protein